MRCAECGAEVSTDDNFCPSCGRRLVENDRAKRPPPGGGPAGAGDKEQLLRAVEGALSAYPQLSATRSDKTDLEIKSVLADAHWGVGRKKVEYSACLLAKEDDRTVVYWEMIKEVGAGMGIFGWFKAEKYKSDGRTLSGAVRETGYGPNGKVIDYNWDYARTRGLVEKTVGEQGWKFTTVLLKKKAMY